uniref:Endonuclease/exonuclease/phosphatase domain-containing protein n=1 Tax=Anopheles atroparvus TaxID=41427 RepID=A0A182IJ64_ANOAO
MICDLMARSPRNIPLILVGDLNQPLITWSPLSPGSLFNHFTPGLSTASGSPLLDLMHLYDLIQLSGIHNANGRQLDLVLANPAAAASIRVTPTIDPLLSIDLHHPPFDIEFLLPERCPINLAGLQRLGKPGGLLYVGG